MKLPMQLYHSCKHTNSSATHLLFTGNEHDHPKHHVAGKHTTTQRLCQCHANSLTTVLHTAHEQHEAGWHSNARQCRT